MQSQPQVSQQAVLGQSPDQAVTKNASALLMGAHAFRGFELGGVPRGMEEMHGGLTARFWQPTADCACHCPNSHCDFSVCALLLDQDDSSRNGHIRARVRQEREGTELCKWLPFCTEILFCHWCLLYVCCRLLILFFVVSLRVARCICAACVLTHASE